MSNKQKRKQLADAREAKGQKAEASRLAKLEAAGRIAHGIVMPEGAIAADLSQQAPNNTYSPLLFYVDHPFKCVDCGKEEVWTAAQQKWYYEVAKGSIYAGAVRCRACRQEHRRSKDEHRRRSQGEPDAE
jgi:hypothetical protein